MIQTMSSTSSPVCETSPFVKYRHRMSVVIGMNARILERTDMSTANGDATNSDPSTRVRLVKLDPMMSPIAS
jgi:hypothetical protein